MLKLTRVSPLSPFLTFYGTVWHVSWLTLLEGRAEALGSCRNMLRNGCNRRGRRRRCRVRNDLRVGAVRGLRRRVG